MTSSATQSGQASTQPAGDTGAAAAAGDQVTTTVLGGDPAAAAKPGDSGQPAAKADGDAAKPGEAKAPEAAKPGAKAPATYEFKMPEGVELDTKALEAFTPALREIDLPQDQAQKLVDVFAKVRMDEATAFTEQLKDEKFALTQVGNVLAQSTETWAAALKTDPEIGGKNYDTNVKTAQRAMARFGSPELKTLLNQTGLGNHPALLRAFLKVGHLVTEDTTDLGAGGAPASRKPAEDVFYGGSKAG
jgi:hypothetical protein